MNESLLAVDVWDFSLKALDCETTELLYFPPKNNYIVTGDVINQRNRSQKWVGLVQGLRLLILISVDGVQFPAKYAFFSESP